MEMYKPANVRLLSERTSETVSSNCTITKAMLYYTFKQYKLNIYRSIHFDQVGNWLLWNLGLALWDEQFLHCFKPLCTQSCASALFFLYFFIQINFFFTVILQLFGLVEDLKLVHSHITPQRSQRKKQHFYMQNLMLIKLKHILSSRSTYF